MSARGPARTAVDVIVPFAGSARALDDALERLGRLELAEGDTLTVVDNRAGTRTAPPSSSAGAVRVVAAPEIRSSYFARNRGAASGTAPWLVFIDSDVEPVADLLERYFEDDPAERTAVLAGDVVDEAPAEDARAAVVFARLRGSMSQAGILDRGVFAYAQTANCAIRRSAFEAVGGFADDVRSGGDADLCFRLAAAGWRLERRPASVTHLSRRSVRALLAQKMRHGAGAAWLDRRHPGSFPRRSLPGLVRWTLSRIAAALAALAQRRRDQFAAGLLDAMTAWAFELGRLLPNRARGAPAASARAAGAGDRRTH